MDKYKKKSINFSKDVENRDLRAYRRSIDRRNAKDVRLSVLRQIDLNDGELDVSSDVQPKDESCKKTEIKQVPEKALSRLDMLRKWKEEKELKKKLEAIKQKPCFKVTQATYKPPPKPQPLPKALNLKNKVIPKPLTTQSTSSLKSRLLPPKTIIKQASVQKEPNKKVDSKSYMPKMTTRTGIKPPSTGSVTSSKSVVNQAKQQLSTKGSSSKHTSAVKKTFLPVTSKDKYLPTTAKSTFLPTASKPTFLPTASKPTFLPTTNKKIMSSKPANTSASKPSSFAPTDYQFSAPLSVLRFDFPNGGPSSILARSSVFRFKTPNKCTPAKQNKEVQKVQTPSFSAKKGITRSSNQKTPLKRDECKKATTSTLLKPPSNIEHASTEKSNLSRDEEYTIKSISTTNLPSEKTNIMKCETKPFLIKDIFPENIDKENISVTGKNSPIADVKGCQEQFCPQEITMLHTNVMVNNVISPQGSSPGLNKLGKRKTRASLKTMLNSADALESEKNSTNETMLQPTTESMSSFITKRDESSIKDVENKTCEIDLMSLCSPDLTGKNLFAKPEPEVEVFNPLQQTVNAPRKLHTIAEDIEIDEDLLFPTSRIKEQDKNSSGPKNVRTPRRSRRLASIHEHSGFLDSKYLEKSDVCHTPDSPFSRGLNAFLNATPDNDLTGNFSAFTLDSPLTGNQESCNIKPRRQSRRKSSLSHTPSSSPSQDNERLSTLQGIQTELECLSPLLFSDKIQTRRQRKISLLGTPEKPLTRRQRKVSLLGTPPKPFSGNRRSLKGDLISFSPL